MKTREKLEALRRLMTDRGLTAYLVPSTDPHQSEYVPECWQRRPWLSGFTGSAGELLVTQKDAGLWTDGRYYLQAEEQLKGSGIRLYRLGEPKVPTLREHLASSLKPGDTLGIDPQLLSMDSVRLLQEALAPSGAVLQFQTDNLVDLLWTDRPQPSADPVHFLPLTYSGEATQSKLRRVREAMKKKEADAHVLSALDAVAWLFNIRGRDVAYNPVAIAYALITAKEAVFFIDPVKVPSSVEKKLSPQVQVRPYGELAAALGELAAKKVRVWLDGGTASRWLGGLVEGCPLVTEPSPVVAMKARKNEVECAGMRAAHERDGVAMVRFLRWLDESVPLGGVTELSAAAKIDSLRGELENFQSVSFNTISGYGAHGAIIHYAATPETDVPLRPEGLYLIDSGGHYLDGTTDITRTVLLGRSATKEQKDRFTRVLKGHISLSRVRFPAGVQGLRLDALARLSLWESGLDYNHGTGHGIGHYLSVHEGPQSINPSRCPTAPIEAGNVLSNEPGFYKAGEYGIRVENVVLVVEDSSPRTNGSAFLRFDTLTLCPIDNRLIDARLLTPEERSWINAYHRRVYKVLSPSLDSEDKKWLKKACGSC